MKKSKKLISLLIAASMTAGMAVLPVTAAVEQLEKMSAKPEHGKYVPSDGVETYKYYFAMPGAWINESTNANDNVPGLYWWSAPDAPDDRFALGWPGYECSREEGQLDINGDELVNLYSSLCPAEASELIWNNYLDSGMDVSADVFKDAQQTRDFSCSYLEPDYDDNYPDATFWEYFYEKAAEQYGFEKQDALINDDLYQAMLDDPDTLDFSDLGEYGKNFFIETENESGLAFNYRNMIYVVDPSDVTYDYTMVPEGKPRYGGDMFFYYGNGLYGTWPTMELALEKGGVTMDADGTYYGFDGKTFNSFGVIRDETGAVALGNIGGSYASQNENPYAPDIPQPTEPDVPESFPEGIEYNEDAIYFYVPSFWNNYKNIRVYLYEYGGDPLINWNSKKGNMTDEGNRIMSFDMSNYPMDDNKSYGVIFLTDSGISTADLLIGNPCLGDIAYCPGEYERLESPLDSNKSVYAARWKNQDASVYGVPVTITSIGNVIGEAVPNGQTAYSIFLKFLKSTGPGGIDNALRFNGKTEKETIDHVAGALGLSDSEIEAAIAESGRTFDWKGSGSSSSSSSSSSSGSSSWSNKYSFKMLEDGTLELTNCAGDIAEIPSCYPGDGTNYSVDDPFAEEGKRPDYKNIPVTAVADWTFANNKYIKEITIPDSVKRIGKGAFYNCVSLENVTLPDSVTELSANAFEKCLYLKSVTLSGKLTSIGDEAFFDCRRLKSLDIPKTVTAIGEEAFTNCRSLKDLVIPEGVKKLGESGVGFGMFENCKSLGTITIPDSVSVIQSNAFDGCGNLTIKGNEGSYAQKFSRESKIMFAALTTESVGDANGDGKVTIDDATDVQKFLAHRIGFTKSQETAADTNGDGRVSIDDATNIQKYLAKMIDKLG